MFAPFSTAGLFAHSTRSTWHASKMFSAGVMVWAIGAVCTPQGAWAEAELVSDMPLTVACREVEDPAFQAEHLGRKLIEARFQISVQVLGAVDDCEGWTLTVRSPEDRLQVVDFTPRTQLESEYSEPIAVSQTFDRTRSLGAGLGASVPLDAVKLSPNVTGQAVDRDVQTENGKRKPPQTAVLVSGTVQSGHGVYFKLPRSPLTSLEGTREFTVRFSAPCAWRGDYVELTLDWSTTRKELWKKVTERREERRLVGLHLSGDTSAQALAQQLAAAQTSYLQRRAAYEQTQSHGLFDELLSSSSKSGRREDLERSITALSSVRSSLRRLAGSETPAISAR